MMLDCLAVPTWCELVALIVAFCELLVVWLAYKFGQTQWNCSKREKRAEFLDKLQQRFDDKEIAEFFYKKIDDETNKRDFYDVEKRCFVEQGDEIAADKLLRLLSYICYLKHGELLTDDEFENFRYVVDTTLTTKGIIAYLKYFYGCHILSDGNLPFDSLLRYGSDKEFAEISGIWKAFEAGERLKGGPSSAGGGNKDFDAYLRENFKNPGTLSSMKARTKKIESDLGRSIIDLVHDDASTKESLQMVAEKLDVEPISIPNYRSVIRCAYRCLHGRNFEE